MTSTAVRKVPETAAIFSAVVSTPSPKQRILGLVMDRLGLQPYDYLGLAVALEVVPRRALNPALLRDRDRNKARKVGNWLSGKNEPNLTATMLMLDLANCLTDEARAAWRGEEQD